MSLFEELSKERKELQAEGKLPSWFTTMSWQAFKQKYLYEADTYEEQIERIVQNVGVHLKDKPEYFKSRWKEMLMKNHAYLSTPPLANNGTKRGLSVSCSGSVIDDSIYGFCDSRTEASVLSQEGFGTSSYLGDIRHRGASISRGGTADGVLPVFKDMVIMADNVSQGNCYIEGTEVLTSEGFIAFRDLTVDTLIAQLDVNRKLSFSKGEYTTKDWNGEVTNISSSTGLNLTVTPNHRMLVERLKQTTINGKRKRHWSGHLEEVLAKDVKYHRDIQHHVSAISTTKYSLTYEDRFKIAYQADGRKTQVRFNNSKFSVEFRFKKQRKIDRLIDILNNLGLEYSITKDDSDGATRIRTIITKELYAPTLQWVDLSIINGSAGVEFLEEVAEWDGSWRKNRTSFCYSSVIQRNVEKVQAVVSVSNARCRTGCSSNRDGNRLDLHTIYVQLKYTPVQGASITKTSLHYKGSVHCCIVPEGRIIVKDSNNFVSVCGNTRRGAWAGYLPIEHEDFWEIALEVKNNPDGSNVGWNISDDVVHKLQLGDIELTKRFQEVLYLKAITGRGYFHFPDKIARAQPELYSRLGLSNKSSGLCNEITLHADKDTSYTCVLSGMVLTTFDEWKDTDAVFCMTVFLDCLVEDFLVSARGIKGLEKVVNGTESSRAIGLGATGYHSALQQRMFPWGGIDAHLFNMEVFNHIHDESLKATKYMAVVYGEPEWCKGTGLRNTHRTALAPNVSSALVFGAESQGITPWYGNVYTEGTASGDMYRVNPMFVKLLDKYGMYNDETLKQVLDDGGSVKSLIFLSDLEKEVLLTAFEINQLEIINTASRRQPKICQGQSVNLFFAADEDESYIAFVHQYAFEDEGIKGLYYMRSKSGVDASKGGCTSCAS